MPIEDADSYREVDAATELQAWGGELAARRTEVNRALDELCSSGCERIRLLYLLQTLESAVRCSQLSKPQAKIVVRDLKNAKKAVRTLRRADPHFVLGIGLQQLEWDLEKLADRLQLFVATLHKSRRLPVDRVKAAFVRYVARMTNAQQPSEYAQAVALLIDAIVSAHPRSSSKDSADSYTLEAHLQWRHRFQKHELLLREAAAFERELWKRAEVIGLFGRQD